MLRSGAYQKTTSQMIKMKNTKTLYRFGSPHIFINSTSFQGEKKKEKRKQREI